jgi:hypothetical protein
MYFFLNTGIRRHCKRNTTTLLRKRTVEKLKYGHEKKNFFEESKISKKLNKKKGINIL